MRSKLPPCFPLMLSTGEKSLRLQLLLSGRWSPDSLSWQGVENAPGYLLLLCCHRLSATLGGGATVHSISADAMLGGQESNPSRATSYYWAGGRLCTFHWLHVDRQQSAVSRLAGSLCYHGITNLPSIFQSLCFRLNVCTFSKFTCWSSNSVWWYFEAGLLGGD